MIVGSTLSDLWTNRNDSNLLYHQGNKVASFQDLPCIAGFAVRCEDSRSTPVHVYHLRLAEDDGGCSS